MSKQRCKEKVVSWVDRRAWAIVVGCLVGILPLMAQEIDERPFIQIAQAAGQTIITFTGTLLTAQTIEGPWQVITNADSPYLVDPVGGPKYFRAGGYGTNSIFSSKSMLTFSLAGPLQAHFEMAFAGLPDGIFPPVRETPYFDAILRMPGFVLPVTLRVRGNSSLQECPFPKLKFKVSKEDRAGTPFADAREIKIGTHCAEGGRGNIGRLREQIAAFREVLVYEAMDLMDFIAPGVRRALVSYQDTTPATNASSTVGWQITREALVFEDIELIAARLGARVLTDEEIPKIDGTLFDTQLSVDLQFFHALIGNWDYSLGWDTRGVWNTEVLEMTDGTKKWLVPVAGDFDLASWVTGIARRMAPQDYHPELGDIERETRYELEQIRKRVELANFNAARARFVSKRTELETLVGSARLDEQGRTNALRHVTAFYEAL